MVGFAFLQAAPGSCGGWDREGNREAAPESAVTRGIVGRLSFPCRETLQGGQGMFARHATPRMPEHLWAVTKPAGA
jgi:hypothetical protein